MVVLLAKVLPVIMSFDEMAELKSSLCAVLIQHGRSANDAVDVVDLAALAASAAIQRLVEIIGTVSEGNRDVAIILAINIMERLALAGYKLGERPDEHVLELTQVAAI